jgi:carboxymethylenebutenolidase
MKKLLVLALFATLLTHCKHIGNQTTCCSADPTATAEFAALALDQNFRNAHELVTTTDTVFSGSMVRFACSSGDSASAYLARPDVPTDKYLLLFHEWWGLNDNIRREADEWCTTLGINVLALDLYDGKLATTPDEAGKLMQGNDAKRSEVIIGGAVKWAGDKADFRTCGWCFGGGWSLRAALAIGPRAKACVVYYGMPEQDVEKLRTLGCDVVFVHASKDKWINDEVVANFETNMKKAGKSVQVHRYDADHAFANPSGPRYQATEATEARKVVTNYLSKK